MKQLKKEQGSAHVIIIVVLIVIILGLLGFVFWQNFIVKKDTPKTEATSASTSASSNSTPQKNDTKTYTNKDLGFSLAYPSEWTFDSSTATDLQAGTIISPATASKKSTSPDAMNYDVAVQTQPVNGSTGRSSSAAVLAYTGNAAEYASMKYTETINSISVTEYDMNAQSSYFAAIFPIGDNYIELDFNVATKANMTTDLTKILQSVKAL